MSENQPLVSNRFWFFHRTRKVPVHFFRIQDAGLQCQLTNPNYFDNEGFSRGDVFVTKAPMEEDHLVALQENDFEF